MSRLLKEPGITFLIIIMICVIGADQFTKALVSSLLDYDQPVTLLPIFDWRLLHNQGAAFSFLSNAGGWQRWLFTGISMGVSVVLFIWLLGTQRSSWLIRYSLSFIIAGALGNLIDRLRFGYVVDFVSVHWQEHYFPAFNVADSFITIGACLMIIDMLFNPEHHK